MLESSISTASADGRHDFNFLFGTWTIQNRRLHSPLTGSTSWYEFASTANERSILGGVANLEQYDAPGAPGRPIHAIAVRLFNTETRRWSIYWSTAGSGEFGVPTVGHFEDGVGTFINRESYGGREISVRFQWSHRSENEALWEQAFSRDDGDTWETNWIMEFTRTIEVR